MSDFRPLTGLYRSFLNGQPLVNALIKIKLSKNDYDLEAGYPVEEKEIRTTDTGHLPADTSIWKTSRGLDGSKVVFTESDGFKWEAAVPEGDAPISVQELRANGTVVTPTATVLQLIANTDLDDLRDVEFTGLTDGDVPVWDVAQQKFVNRQIAGGSGGGFTLEQIQDSIAAMLQGGANTTLNYNDGANTLTIGETTAAITSEQIQDMIAGFLQAGSNITLTYNDAGNVLTIAAAGGSGGGTQPLTSGKIAFMANPPAGFSDGRALSNGIEGSFTANPDTSAVVAPYNNSVYQHYIKKNAGETLTLPISGLYPSANYRVKLSFCRDAVPSSAFVQIPRQSNRILSYFPYQTSLKVIELEVDLTTDSSGVLNLSFADNYNAGAFLNAVEFVRQAAPTDAVTKEVDIIGDSITFTGDSDLTSTAAKLADLYGGANIYLFETARRFNASKTVRVRNLGISSEVIQDARIRAAYHFADYNSAATKIVVLFSGSNNLVPTSEAALKTEIQGLYNDAVASGKTAYQCTLLPRIDVTGANETKRLNINAWIRSTFPNNYIETALMPHATNPANQTYYDALGIHPSAVLRAEIAGVIYNKIEGITSNQTEQVILQEDSIMHSYGVARGQSFAYLMAVAENANCYEWETGNLIPPDAQKLKKYIDLAVPGRRNDQFISGATFPNNIFYPGMTVEVGGRINDANVTKILFCGSLNDYFNNRTFAQVTADLDTIDDYFKSIGARVYYTSVPNIAPSAQITKAQADVFNALSDQTTQYLINRVGETQVFRLDKNTATADPATATLSDGVHYNTAAIAAVVPALLEFKKDNYVPVRFSTVALGNAQVGVAYQQNINSTGGNGSKTLTKKSGTLTAGLTFNASQRRIEGAATAGGTFSVTFRDTDSLGNFDEKTYSLTVVGSSNTVIANDNFNVSDRPIESRYAALVGASFGATATANVVNNQLVFTQANDSGGKQAGYYIADEFADGVIEATFKEGNALVLLGRYKPNGDCYLAVGSVAGTFVDIYKSTGNNLTAGTPTAFALQTGDRLRLKMEGSTLTFSYIRNGVETIVKQTTDTDLTAGSGGFCSPRITTTIDDFYVEKFS